MKTSTQVVLGLALGVAAGAVIAMLLTPENKKELKNKIKDNAQDWLNQFSTLLNTGRDVTEQVKAKTQEEVQNLKSHLTQVH